LSDESKPVDYLREISKWLERYGDTESACEVLDKAIELAKGEKKKALQRLQKTYQQRLETLNEEEQTPVQD
jgi:predicted LPLAT superfamily acyltransferase